MELLAVPVAIAVTGYVIARIVRYDVMAIVQEAKLLIGFMVVMIVPMFALPIYSSTGSTTEEGLNNRTASLIQSATSFIADHAPGVVIGVLVAAIAGAIVSKLIKPLMDALDL